jgi:hypothetical protein
MQHNSLFPLIKRGNRNAKLLTDFLDGRSALEVRYQYSEYEAQAVSAIRDYDVREQGVGSAAGFA